jgi:hypothetical protein
MNIIVIHGEKKTHITTSDENYMKRVSFSLEIKNYYRHQKKNYIESYFIKALH